MSNQERSNFLKVVIFWLAKYLDNGTMLYIPHYIMLA
jgi:hypothetical protein